MHVEDCGQVWPAFCSVYVGEVGEPNLVRMRGLKATDEPVRGDRIAIMAVSGPGRCSPVKLAALDGAGHNHFSQERHFISRDLYRERRSAALAEWRAVMG